MTKPNLSTTGSRLVQPNSFRGSQSSFLDDAQLRVGVLSGTPTAETSTKVFAYNSAAAIKGVTVKVIDLDDWKYSMDLTLVSAKVAGIGRNQAGSGSVTIRLKIPPVPEPSTTRQRHQGRWLANKPTSSNPTWIKYDFTKGKNH